MSTDAKELLKVLTKDKKYTVVQHDDGRLEILRYGEHWRDETGDQLILTLAQDLDESRDVSAKLASELLWIIQVCRNGTIKWWPMMSLEEHIWKALNTVGIIEQND
jgi:hypothetical protein